MHSLRTEIKFGIRKQLIIALSKEISQINMNIRKANYHITETTLSLRFFYFVFTTFPDAT